MDDFSLKTAFDRLLGHSSPALSPEKLRAYVTSFVEDRTRFLTAADRFGSPLYVIDADRLAQQAAAFRQAFAGLLSRVECYFAVKSNNHPDIARVLIENGFGLDVSSGVELQMALELGAKRIVFSGPGKTLPELELAVAHADRVIVHMDSFSELPRLDAAAKAASRTIRAGVRLTTEENGLWRKFGIVLADLPQFFDRAASASHVELAGMQFHTSWNMTPEKPVAFLERLGDALATLDDKARSRIRFLDIGGGYWPPMGEWLTAESTPEGQLKQLLKPGPRRSLDHHCFDSTPIDAFARAIADALDQHVFSRVDCAVFAEPGRWICNDGMHILLTVVDKKGDDLIITDGGTNAVGWERFETDYFPVINLSRPALSEHPAMILGSLCTPHDVWGYACFGDGIEPGDRLLIPTQGAYTYSLRQHFIKALPRTVIFQGNEILPSTS